ncbi:glutathione S-transferase 1-like [Spodoptera litura]|uniref:Glutathione S-transferase 1-like n=2 Tax=Spodoptera litura TaxID=69820 RepID=A0A9J7IWF9_SPOLT|nr:glutathione S-transferase 1-like [Spodoptera litura]
MAMFGTSSVRNTSPSTPDVMTIIIHKTDVSPPARATLILVDLLGLKIETREVNLPTRQQFNPEYLEKNPLHTVPLLEDDGLVLQDSHAIMIYLMSKYGIEHESLYPKDLAARAIVNQRLFFDASILFPRLKTVIYSTVKHGIPMTEAQETDIKECYDVAEKYLTDQYIAGDTLTLADISCVTTISSLDCIVPIHSKYRRLHDWWSRLKKEPWYQKINQPGLALFGRFIKGFL